MKRRKQPSRLKLFYYSHPYFVIFNLLIIYNIILIAAAALVMTYLMKGTTDGNFTMALDWKSYLKNLEYCAVFTMNTGGIYDQAPTSVIILKIILSILQMITFTGALIGLATSILQAMFDKRIHNLGKIKIKHHYVILEWSAVGSNLIRELSFMKGHKTVVVLSNQNRNEIIEEIDNMFLESGTSKKNIKIFVKQGSPFSRKALKEINVDKAASIAILGASSWLEQSKKSDSTSFKILMSVLSITKKTNIVIETDDSEVTKNIHDLMAASMDLKDAHISIFSRNTVVGHVLAKTAINANYADLYYSLMSFRGGTFFTEKTSLSVSEALSRYNNGLPAFRYKSDYYNDEEILFVNADSENFVYRSLRKKKYSAIAPFKKNLINNSFTLYVIGENDRSLAIKEAVEQHNSLNEGKVNLTILPVDADIDKLLENISKGKGKKKILILSDNNAEEDNVDSNVFLSLIKIKANKELSKDVEVFAEIFEPSNRFSLETLNITGVIIANQMVAVYMSQLMCHIEQHNLYEDLLMPDDDSDITFEIRLAKELLDIKKPLEFNSRGDFINSVYQSSKQEYLPFGFVGEKDKKSLVGSVTDAVEGMANMTEKVFTSITNALTLADSPEETMLDINNIIFLNNHLSRKEKVIIKPDTTLIVVHNKK